jgi:nucleoside phosphorylase
MIEFSAMLSAVKPRGRTDQYVILAALRFLRANTEPVTTTQVSGLLRQHLRTKQPSNIGASLRSYSAYVERVDSSTPVRWKLTRKGVEKFSELSGLVISSEEDSADYDIDVAFVCALQDPEFAALELATCGHSTWADIPNTRLSHLYKQTTLLTKGGKTLKVVGTVATSMGLTASSIATTQMIMQFRPRLVVMVGIAAGTRSGNKEFGDVLVADPSVDYNSGKVVSENGIREFLPDPYPIGLNARLRAVLNRYRVPNVMIDQISMSWNKQRPATRNRLHLGPVGAADQVIDDESRIVEIQKNWRKLIGVEMETYGVYRACHEAPEPKPRFVSFKSVCDFAASKTDSWQDYAAFLAANFAIVFLKTEWDAICPSNKTESLK